MKIAALQLQQVEGINARGHVPPVRQRKKIGLAVDAGEDQLAIDDAGVRQHPETGRSDPREPEAEIAAAVILITGRFPFYDTRLSMKRAMPIVACHSMGRIPSSFVRAITAD